MITPATLITGTAAIPIIRIIHRTMGIPGTIRGTIPRFTLDVIPIPISTTLVMMGSIILEEASMRLAIIISRTRDLIEALPAEVSTPSVLWAVRLVPWAMGALGHAVLRRLLVASVGVAEDFAVAAGSTAVVVAAFIPQAAVGSTAVDEAGKEASNLPPILR